MAGLSTSVEVYLESGKQRTVAGAFDWPGWCRIGRDEDSALQALVDAGPRYARALHAVQLAFQPPADASAFAVVERLAGTATTTRGQDIGGHISAAFVADRIDGSIAVR